MILRTSSTLKITSERTSLPSCRPLIDPSLRSLNKALHAQVNSKKVQVNQIKSINQKTEDKLRGKMLILPTMKTNKTTYTVRTEWSSSHCSTPENSRFDITVVTEKRFGITVVTNKKIGHKSCNWKKDLT